MGEEQEERTELWERWNMFLDLLGEAKKFWEEEVRGASRGEVELYGGSKAKILQLYRREKFEILTPRLIEYYRGYGGLEAMKSMDKNKKPEEEMEGASED